MSPADARLSFTIIVLIPTSLWTVMICAAAWMCDYPVPQVGVLVIATVIGLFLAVIWTLLMTSRAMPSAD